MEKSVVDFLIEKFTPANWTEEQFREHFKEQIGQAKELFQKQIQDAHLHASRFNGPLARQLAWEYYRDNFKQE